MGSLYLSKHELVFVYRVGSAPHFNAVELGRQDAAEPTSGIMRRSRLRAAVGRTWPSIRP